MFLAAGGVPSLRLVALTMIGGCLAAASANAINCVLDRDIDEQMRRTRRRPLPRHAIGPRAAMIFGLVLGVAATLWLGFFVNWLSAGLALAANAFYVFVYTLWLKRRTSQNIVWGGIAGCFPPLIGWTAVTGSVAWAPFVLFAIVFCWTPPHTWALALRYREDYALAGVPMLPVVRSAPAVTGRIAGLLGDHRRGVPVAVADRRHRLAVPGGRGRGRCRPDLGGRRARAAGRAAACSTPPCVRCGSSTGPTPTWRWSSSPPPWIRCCAETWRQAWPSRSSCCWITEADAVIRAPVGRAGRGRPAE